MRHLQFSAVSVIAATVGMWHNGAQATVRVGGALSVEQVVLGSLSGQGWKPKFRGSDVYEAESIRTGAASNAVLDFIDKTQLELGPTARMKVDRVVFNSNRSVRTLMVNAESGPVRWISGESGHGTYEVTTPNVTVTPQGTIFDLFVTPERTVVVLQEGIIRVCLVNAPQACRLLSQPGEVIIGTRSGLEGPRAGGPTQSEFASRCLSAASQNCMMLASVTPPREPPPSTRPPQDYRRSGKTKSGTYRTQSDVPARKTASVQHRDHEPTVGSKLTYSRWGYRRIVVPSRGYVPGGSMRPGGYSGSVRPGGYSGFVRPGGYSGSVRPGGYSGFVRPGSYSGSVRPGGYSGFVRPGGYSGSVRPGGYSGFVRPGGYSGSVRPGGYSGSVRPGGYGGSMRPGGFMRPGGYGGSMRPGGFMRPGGYGGSMRLGGYGVVRLPRLR